MHDAGDAPEPEESVDETTSRDDGLDSELISLTNSEASQRLAREPRGDVRACPCPFDVGPDGRRTTAPLTPRGIDPCAGHLAQGGGGGARTDHSSFMTPATLRRHRWAVRARSLAIAGRARLRSSPGICRLPRRPSWAGRTHGPVAPAGPHARSPVPASLSDINGVDGTPSSSIIVLVAITLLSVAPSLLLMTTSFTKVFVVLVLTRNALGLQGTPPTQVLAGLSLFLSLFIMGPVLGQMNDQGVQPYIHGEVTFGRGLDAAVVPLKGFMLEHTRESDIALMTRASESANPDTKADVSMTTLMPAFMLSELRSAFIIGFVIFVPFLVIDLVVSGALMSMGMMMLPPVMVSLPFKLLLFVLVDGWTLVITALIGSYH